MSGSWLLYNVYRLEAKEQMKSFIQSHPKDFNVVQFNITAQNNSDFNIDDDGNELAYNNVLYDVVAKKTNSGNVVVSCLKDINETNIIDAFNNYIEKLHKQSSNSKSAEQHHFSNQLYDNLGFSVSLNHPAILIFSPSFCFQKIVCNNILAEVVTPPPETNM